MSGYEEEEKRPFNLRVWAKLGPFLRPYQKQIAVILIFQLLCAAIDIILSLIHI